MRLSLLLLLGCLAAIASAGCIHTGTSLMLDEDDFEDKVVKSDALITFVEFSSPWCIWAIPNSNGHGDCATMRKDWDRLADTYRARDLVEIAEVDCSRWVHHPAGEDGTYKTKESLCQRFSIRSYPTVYVFDGASGANGTLYEGGMSYDEMHTFLESEHAKLCEISAVRVRLGCNRGESMPRMRLLGGACLGCTASCRRAARATRTPRAAPS